MAGRYVPNERGMDEFLHGHSGPVYRLLDRAAREAAVAARQHAPHDKGLLERSIEAHAPERTSNGLTARVSAHRTGTNGADVALIVHQGRGAIRPMSARKLVFFWKKAGRVIALDEVGPRRGRPYLVAGLTEIAARFGMTLRNIKPPRMNGS